MESTEGPVEHAKIRCVQKHWFLLPVAVLAAPRHPVRRGGCRINIPLRG
ncbi:MAG: hypothetical protein JWQ93_2922 [Marmoricola sp.]|jgi:hypothetical protein|nr:hypothetical protein [Marmoricola sp.]MCW2837580.1 hypothetical protein [Marmoricola sp.]